MSRAAGPRSLPWDRPQQTADPVTSLLAILVIIGFVPELFLQGSSRDDVLVELIKLAGIMVSAVASSFALWIAQQNRKTNRRVERKVEAKRKTVRRSESRGEDPTVTIVEDRREPRDRNR